MQAVRFKDEVQYPVRVKKSTKSVNKVNILAIIVFLVIIGILIYGIWLPFTVVM